MAKRISIIGLRAFPPEFIGTSGIEFYVENVLKKIVKQSDQLHFTIYTRSRYQKKLTSLPTIKTVSLPSLSGKWLEAVSYSFTASLVTSLDSSSTVWYHGVGPAIFSIFPKLAGKKIIITIHSLDWDRDKWNKIEKYLFLNFVKIILSTTSSKCFCVSSKLAENMYTRFGVNSIIAPPGITLHKVIRKKKLIQKKYFLYLGRIVPEKRLEWLLDYSIKNVVNVIVAGGHGNLKSYENKLKIKYSQKNIQWLDYVFGEEKIKLLQYAQALVIPSKLEGFSISFTEALGYRKYCVIAEDFVDKKLHLLHNVITYKLNSENAFHRSLKNAFKSSINRTNYPYSEKETKILSGYKWQLTAYKYKNYLIV
jgi:glycosyltransferase involved in cell wall biosynthesis